MKYFDYDFSNVKECIHLLKMPEDKRWNKVVLIFIGFWLMTFLVVKILFNVGIATLAIIVYIFFLDWLKTYIKKVLIR